MNEHFPINTTNIVFQLVVDHHQQVFVFCLLSHHFGFYVHINDDDLLFSLVLFLVWFCRLFLTLMMILCSLWCSFWFGFTDCLIFYLHDGTEGAGCRSSSTHSYSYFYLAYFLYFLFVFLPPILILNSTSSISYFHICFPFSGLFVPHANHSM